MDWVDGCVFKGILWATMLVTPFWGGIFVLVSLVR